MTDYVITLTDTERMAMEFIAADTNDWIQHAVHERARVAIEEIIQLSVQKFIEAGQSIPGSKDEIVAAAYANGWVKTAQQRNAEFTINMPSPSV